MSRLRLRLIIACCSLNVAVGCVRQTQNSIVRCWADWNTLGHCAAYYEKVDHKPYYPARVGYFKAMYNANPGHGRKRRLQLVEHGATGDFAAAPCPSPSGESNLRSDSISPHGTLEAPPPAKLAPPKVEAPAPRRDVILPLPPPPTKGAPSQSDNETPAPSEDESPGLSLPKDFESSSAADESPTLPDVGQPQPTTPAPPVSTPPIDSGATIPPESSAGTMDFLREKANSGRAFLRSFFGP